MMCKIAIYLHGDTVQSATGYTWTLSYQTSQLSSFSSLWLFILTIHWIGLGFFTFCLQRVKWLNAFITYTQYIHLKNFYTNKENGKTIISYQLNENMSSFCWHTTGIWQGATWANVRSTVDCVQEITPDSLPDSQPTHNQSTRGTRQGE